jgi:hypothetical protein
VPFPISIRGTLPLPRDPDAIEAACAGLVEVLEKQGARVEEHYLPRIRATVPLYRGLRWNWDFVAPLDRLDFEVVETADGPGLSYKLSLLRLVAIGSLGLVGMAVAAGRADFPFGQVWVWPVMWGWVIGGNYLFTLARAKAFLRRATTSNQIVSTPAVVQPRQAREPHLKQGFPPINWP